MEHLITTNNQINKNLKSYTFSLQRLWVEKVGNKFLQTYNYNLAQKSNQRIVKLIESDCDVHSWCSVDHIINVLFSYHHCQISVEAM